MAAKKETPSDDGLDELLGSTTQAKEGGEAPQNGVKTELVDPLAQMEFLKKQTAELQAKLEASEQARKKAEAKAKKEVVEEQYVPASNERNLYHLRMAKRVFHETTRERLEVPFIQKYTVSEYRSVSPNFQKLGYDDITILWDPTVNK